MGRVYDSLNRNSNAFRHPDCPAAAQLDNTELNQSISETKQLAFIIDLDRCCRSSGHSGDFLTFSVHPDLDVIAIVPFIAIFSGKSVHSLRCIFRLLSGILTPSQFFEDGKSSS
jgi:hypothetical protein